MLWAGNQPGGFRRGSTAAARYKPRPTDCADLARSRTHTKPPAAAAARGLHSSPPLARGQGRFETRLEVTIDGAPAGGALADGRLGTRRFANLDLLAASTALPLAPSRFEGKRFKRPIQQDRELLKASRRSRASYVGGVAIGGRAAPLDGAAGVRERTSSDAVAARGAGTRQIPAVDVIARPSLRDPEQRFLADFATARPRSSADSGAAVYRRISTDRRRRRRDPIADELAPLISATPRSRQWERTACFLKTRAVDRTVLAREGCVSEPSPDS